MASIRYRPYFKLITFDSSNSVKGRGKTIKNETLTFRGKVVYGVSGVN